MRAIILSTRGGKRLSNIKPIVRYFYDGEWRDATVKDIGDLNSLTTIVKTDLVSAINSLQASSGSISSEWEQIIKDLENGVVDLETIVNGVANGGLNDKQKLELDAKIKEVNDKIIQINQDVATEIEGFKNSYNERVSDVETGVFEAKESIERYRSLKNLPFYQKQMEILERLEHNFKTEK